MAIPIPVHPLWPTVQGLYEVHEWRNALAVLQMVHPTEWDEILTVLSSFRLKKSAILQAGGNKTQEIASKLDKGFYDRGWSANKFDTSITVKRLKPTRRNRRVQSTATTKPLEEFTYDSPTHIVDCYKNKVGLEIEWNNKDPFFDRDLNNFRLLFELRVVDVGVIVTRCDELPRCLQRPRPRAKLRQQYDPHGPASAAS